jgi:flagellar basal-body rod modification protein FlgD
MSAIPAVSPKSDSGGTEPTPTQTPVSEAQKQKNMFLSLMVAQIKNQDPLNPMDSTQFTTQLAQMTSLEQLAYVREDVAKIAEAIAGTADTTNSSQETK